jgi:hypothetical protein
VGKIIVVTKYGPIYLDREEYEKRVEQMLDSYYAFLARSVFELRERAFWEYHKNELKNAGYPISFARLIKAWFLELLNLRNTVRRIRLAVREKGRARLRPPRRGTRFSARYIQRTTVMRMAVEWVGTYMNYEHP